MGLEESRFLPCPPQEGGSLPSPFLQVGDGGSHGSADSVPGMVLCLKLVVGGCPCLFKGWELVRWPGLQELMDGLDVVNDDLVSRVYVALGVEIIGAVKEPAFVMAQMRAHGLSQGGSVPGRKALAFNAPQCSWLNASSMEPQTNF